MGIISLMSFKLKMGSGVSGDGRLLYEGRNLHVAAVSNSPSAHMPFVCKEKPSRGSYRHRRQSYRFVSRWPTEWNQVNTVNANIFNTSRALRLDVLKCCIF